MVVATSVEPKKVETSKELTNVIDDSPVTNERAPYAPKVGILVINRDGQKWLAPLLNSLRNDGYANKVVYLIDNASSDNSVSLVHEQFPEVVVLLMPTNLGYCMAYNLAMKAAFNDGCDWVVWQNNDTLVLPGWLQTLVDVSQSDPKIGVLGPAFLNWENDEPNHYMRSAAPQALNAMINRDPKPVDVGWVEGSCLMVSRACVEHVGWLDPWLFVYFEETDFCGRCWYHGWRVVLAPTSLARHFGGAYSAQNQQMQAGLHWMRLRNMNVNYWTYPTRSFLRNFFDVCGLAIVQQKDAWLRRRSPRQSWICFKAFLWTLWQAPTIYQKWRRDRNREPLPMLTTEFEDLLKQKPMVRIAAGKETTVA